MNEIIKYFQNIPSAHRSLIIIGGICFFWILETGFPLFKLKYKKWEHALINIFFTITSILINFILAFFLYKCFSWVSNNQFGIINWLNIESLVLQTIIGLLLMDFIGAYLIHYIEHKFSLLWRFHLVHHTDQWIDTTSANRHHPGESVFRFIFTSLAIIIVGAPLWLFFLYQTTSVLLSQFNHSNLKLPQKIDQVISYLIVSPNMHKVHHHYVLPYTDSNYGNIFSVWDRLFGTYSTLPYNQIIYGVDTHMSPKEHNNLLNLLKIPFYKKRNPVGTINQ